MTPPPPSAVPPLRKGRKEASPSLRRRGQGGGQRGFTLIEVLLASVILTLGTLLLHQTYLRLSDLYGRYVSGMRLSGWVNDQLWITRESIVYSSENQLPGFGSEQLGSKVFSWRREVRPLSDGLYSIRMEVSWSEGNRPVNLAREIYAYQRKLT